MTKKEHNTCMRAAKELANYINTKLGEIYGEPMVRENWNHDDDVCIIWDGPSK